MVIIYGHYLTMGYLYLADPVDTAGGVGGNGR